MEKKITYKNVADYFIALSNETQSLITNMKLQKLVYYAQAWNLGLNGDSLFDEEFEAWVHGPVLPTLYNEYRKFGWKPILREDLVEGSLEAIKASFSQPINSLLDDVAGEYFGMTAYALEKLTHQEEPWLNARIGLNEDQPSNNIIKKGDMLSYYSKFVEDVEEDKA